MDDSKKKKRKKPDLVVVESMASVGAGYNPQITIDKYNEMWKAYVEHGTISGVARAVGVSRQTAKRYIDNGDPKRSLRSFRQRVRDVVERIQDEEDIDYEKSMSKALQLVNKYEGIISKKIDSMISSDGEVTDLALASIPAELSAVLEKLAKTKSFLLGGPDSRSEIKGRFDTYNKSELMAFIQTGKEPLSTIITHSADDEKKQ